VTAVPVDDTIEARVEALEKNIEHVHERINGAQREIDGVASELRHNLGQEQQTRIEEQRRLWDRLEVTETGGLHLSSIGAIWLAIGVTMSTAAPELAKWWR
jgi:hypothetical protein